MLAISAASRIARSVASSTPKAMFSRSVSLKRNVSCGTYPIARRSSASGHSRIERPSINSDPGGASHSRAINAASVDLPLPVGPTIASVEPAGMCRLMSCSTGSFGAPLRRRSDKRTSDARNSISPRMGISSESAAKRSRLPPYRHSSPTLAAQDRRIADIRLRVRM